MDGFFDLFQALFVGGVDEVDLHEGIGGLLGAFEDFGAGFVVFSEESGDVGHGGVEFFGHGQKEVCGAESAGFAGLAGGGFAALLVRGLVFLAGGFFTWLEDFGFWFVKPSRFRPFSVCEPL